MYKLIHVRAYTFWSYLCPGWVLNGDDMIAADDTVDDVCE